MIATKVHLDAAVFNDTTEKEESRFLRGEIRPLIELKSEPKCLVIRIRHLRFNARGKNMTD